MATGFGSGLSTLLLLRLLASLPFLHETNAACFYPSGRIAPNDVPCRDDTPHAACCGQGYACLSNGICQATGEELAKPGATEFVRGACTDQTWRSSSCPLFCITEDVDFLDGGNGIHKCDNVTQDLYFCINAKSGEEASCEERRGLLYFAGTPSVITTIGVAPRTTSSSISTRATATSISTNTSDIPSATSANSGDTAPTPTSTATDDSNGTAPSRSPSNVGAIIGGAVGGTVAVIIAGVTGWLLARRRRSTTVSGVGPGISSNHTDTHRPDEEFKYHSTAAPAHQAEVYEAPDAAQAWELHGLFGRAEVPPRGPGRGAVAELPGGSY